MTRFARKDANNTVIADSLSDLDHVLAELNHVLPCSPPGNDELFTIRDAIRLSPEQRKFRDLSAELKIVRDRLPQFTRPYDDITDTSALAASITTPLPVSFCMVGSSSGTRTELGERIQRGGTRAISLDLVSDGWEVMARPETSLQANKMWRSLIQKAQRVQQGRILLRKELGSMVSAELLVRALGDQNEGDLLDMCSAPGGKTLQIASHLPVGMNVVANDVLRNRLRRVGEGAREFGLDNVICSNADGISLGRRAPESFAGVMCDVPCSGTGRLRRDPFALVRAMNGQVDSLLGVQAGLLRAAIETAKPGAPIVYSTCSLEPEENEEVLAYVQSVDGGKIRFEDPREYFRQDHGVELLDEAYSNSRLVQYVRGVEGDLPALRFWPHGHDLRFGGFFLALLRKC